MTIADRSAAGKGRKLPFLRTGLELEPLPARYIQLVLDFFCLCNAVAVINVHMRYLPALGTLKRNLTM